MNKSDLMVLALGVVCMAALATAQSPPAAGGGIPTCATKLAPCFDSLNSTKPPPKTCCDPLTEAVTKEAACLCNIYNNPALLQTFNVNVTQALNLITRCKVTSIKDPNTLCKAVAPAVSPSSYSTGSTPASPGGASTSSPPAANANANANANAAPTITTRANLAGLVSIAVALGTYTVFY